MSKKVQILVDVDSGRADAALKALQGTLKDLGIVSQRTGVQVRESTKMQEVSLAAYIHNVEKAAQYARQFYDVVKQSAELQDARQYFREYASSIGVSMEQMVSASKRATRSQVDDLTLTKSTYAALRNGVTVDVGEMARLWRVADTASDNMKTTTVEAFNRITDAIQSGSSRQLVTMGVLPASFKRSSDAASLLEQRVELLNAVFKEFGQENENISQTGGTATDQFERFEAKMVDLKLELGENLIPTFLTLVGTLETVAKTARDTAEALYLIEKREPINPFVGLSTEEIDRRIKLTTDRYNRLLGDLETQPNAEQEFVKTGGSFSISTSLAASRQALEQEKIALEERLDLMQKARGVGEQMAVKAAEHKGQQEKLTQATAGTTKEAEKLAKAAQKAQDTVEKMTRELLEGFGVKGVKSLKEAEQVMIAATMACGGMSQGLADATGKAQAFYKTLKLAGDTSEDIASRFRYGGFSTRQNIEQLKDPSKVMFDFADSMVGGALSGEGFKKPSPQKVQKQFKDVLEQPLAKVFNDAFVKGLEGGDFFQALGDGLKRVVIESFANQLTSALFGMSGATAYVSGSGGSGSSVSAASGGSGLLSGVLKPIWNKGQLNLGALGQNLAIGFAVDRLFGEGGLFGSRKVNGQESIQQASDINQRLIQAVASRDSMLFTAIGATEQSIKALERITFTGAGYSWSDSGDGIFSKKTRTYQLDAGAAQQSLAEFEAMAKIIAEEVATRTFERNMIGVSDPTQAVIMLVSDLRDALSRMSADDSRSYDLQLQLAQAQAQLGTIGLQRSTTMAGMLISSPYAQNMPEDIFTMPFFGEGYSRDFDKEILDLATRFRESAPSGGRVKLKGYDDWIDLTTLGDVREKQLLMSGAEQQYKTAFEIEKLLRDPGTFQKGLEMQRDLTTAYSERLQEIIDAASAAAVDVTRTVAERTAAFETYQQAIQKYFATQSELLEIEAALEEENKSKLEERTSDILSTLLTRIGEEKTFAVGGKTVVVLSPGQPDAKALARELRDAQAGSNPELAAVLDQFINATSKPYF